MIHARQDYNENFQEKLNNIPKDEPVFFLRGQDLAAPAALEAWADENERIGGDIQLTKSTREHAKLMREYQQTHKSKRADISGGGTGKNKQI